MHIVKRIGQGIAILAGVLGALFLYRANDSLPRLDGEVRHASLSKPVKVVRDTWGVPHIDAQTETDAYFALGYVTAQDRLFQMELLRRVARGELSALLGPKLLEVDRLVRAFRLAPKAEEIYASRPGEHLEMRAAVDAFVAGINHRIKSEPAPIEFTLLGIPRRPFTPVDCLVIAALLPITFAEGLRGDPLKSMLLEKLPELPVDLLFPGYSLEDPPITVMESIEEARAFLAEQAAAAAAAAPGDLEAREPAARALDDAAARRALEPFVLAWHGLAALFGPTFGSNSWVLAGSRTRSGKPLLAGDPHIAMTNPGIWYEAHLRYPGADLYGYFLPLIPFALLGHNTRHAWTLTMLENDDVDLYRETFDPADPGRVMYKGQWVDAQVETSKIPVRFGEDTECTIRVTPHGPVITDLLKTLIGYQGPDLSMSWVWQHVEYTDMVAFYRMSRAASMPEFRDAVALITSPGLNISYADAEGNIAWWGAGRIPIRPEGLDPKIILDGASGDHELLGYLPFEANPHLINPPSGCIASGNNMPTVKPVGPMGTMQGYWQESDRAARIEALLEPRNGWSLEDLKAVQTDDYAEAPHRIAQLVAETLRAREAPLDPIEAQALEQLAAWDGFHRPDQLGAAVYHCLQDAVWQRALEDELGPDLLEAYTALADSWHFFKHFVFHPEVPFWDDQRTPEPESRDGILEQAFRDAAKACRKRLGRNPQKWTWGRLHAITYRHPIGYVPGFSWLFNVGPIPIGGGDRVVNNLQSVGFGNFEPVAGPSTRRLIDMAGPARALSVLPTGNSGHFLSAHYDDQAGLYAAGDYRPMYLDAADIAENALHTLEFLPAER